ncbi:carbon-nitrogen hydrolase family protein [Persicitalea jodogahamensis]|uniref:CN hydrolase domain-containing protein n=1 Tax=Persicitalea jodogahamensis TaxID=402147 RepID=A0A8J3DBX3_9BACT|nr:carbon-nitrogen hydrolase family protein [Persicitalea jodogahamensis]GHB87017.1 hypothetical protein GCM10007390_48570 [Persicitalea jodogahamensis]
MKKYFIKFLLLSVIILFGETLLAQEVAGALHWESASILPKLSPEFYIKTTESGSQVLGIKTNRKNQHGLWKASVPVEGGHFYAFSIKKQVSNIADVRRATPVNIHWLNAAGKTVLRDRDYNDKRLGLETFVDPEADWPWTARPEIPYREKVNEDGSVTVASVFKAPANATHAVVELHLRWDGGAKVEWRDFSLQKTASPAKQKVKVAAVFQPFKTVPKVKTPEAAVRLFAPFIKEAADKGAKLICLPEVLTKKFTDLPNDQVAEPIPGGAATNAFQELARQNNMYIVAGMVEGDRDTLYNTAILVGPEGFIGKYRKVVLTLAEANASGLTPGTDYPVFDTKIGKIGMMICYDLYFPEVARQLSRNGAEIIAMPIAGGNPVLAQARAIENQVYLVTSTYDVRGPWIKTAIFDYDGQMLDQTDKPGTLAIAEVEISELPRYWGHLGDLKADIFIQEPKN